jgi:hypothetical protein
VTASKVVGVLRALETYVFGQSALIIDYATARSSDEPHQRRTRRVRCNGCCIVGWAINNRCAGTREEYFAWLGVRPPTYQTLHEYPGGRHVSGDQAKALLGID